MEKLKSILELYEILFIKLINFIVGLLYTIILTIISPFFKTSKIIESSTIIYNAIESDSWI